MKKTAKNILTLGLIAGFALTFNSCKKKGCMDTNADNYMEDAKKDDGSCTYPTINTNGNGTSGDIAGQGGTASSTVMFDQTNATLGWDMAQNASAGSFNLTILDADGTQVMTKTLVAGSGAQDASGTTSAGTTGSWSATVTLTDFVGTGDYSFQ